MNGLFHLGYSDFITQVDINKCEASVCFTFPTAVCTFRSGEYRIEASSYKIIIALVNTLRQLLSYVALPGLNGAYASIYATAHDTPKAVPIAANTAEARFHRNLISLDLFSCVILKNTSFLNGNYFNYSSLIVFSSPHEGDCRWLLIDAAALNVRA